MRVLRLVGSAAIASILSAGAMQAQDVQTIEINPVSMTLRVGESRTILATPRDARGNPLVTTNLSWQSLNPAVLQIRFNPATPNVVTVTAVSAGVAQIEAVSGNITSQMVISVEGPAAPTTPDSVLPADVVDATIPQIARIEPTVFGAPPTCRVGGFIGNDLLITTYTAIRGADRISITLNGGRTIDNVTVATHDVTANIAVLHAPGANAGALTPGSDPSGSEQAWALGQPSCSQTVPLPVQVTSNSVDRELNAGQMGSPIVDRSGNLIGLAMGGTDMTAISGLSALMNRGRANAAAGTTATPGTIADRENHRHGTIIVASDATGARGRVTPIENWHWAELATEGTFPLTVNGAAGRYRIELLTGGTVRSTETFLVVAGETNNQAINLPPVVAPPPGPPAEEQLVTPQAGGGGGGIVFVLLGLAAAGGAAAVLLGGGGGCPDGQTGTPPDCMTPPPPPGDPGSITIRIPIPN